MRFPPLPSSLSGGGLPAIIVGGLRFPVRPAPDADRGFDFRDFISREGLPFAKAIKLAVMGDDAVQIAPARANIRLHIPRPGTRPLRLAIHCCRPAQQELATKRRFSEHRFWRLLA